MSGLREASGSRQGWQMRRLQELPIQGVPETLEICTDRWKCRNEQCAQKTFAETLAIAPRSARKTQRVGELVRLCGHAGDGRVSERCWRAWGCLSTTTPSCGKLKSHVRKQRKTESLRAIAIETGTGARLQIRDHCRRSRAAHGSGRSEDPPRAGDRDCLKQHPGIEFVSRA